MKYKMTKNLIVLGAIIFSFAFSFINNVFAYSCSGYSCVDSYDPYYEYNMDNNYRTSRNNYNSDNYRSDTTGGSNSSVVNNYYYPVATAKTTTSTSSDIVKATEIPVTEAKSNTTSNSNSTTTDISRTYTNSNSNLNEGTYNSGINGNLLGASAYNSNGNDLTALSVGGSGGFMPSSIWQWIFVVALILVIIILIRMFVKKPSPYDHDVHVTH